MPAAPPDDRPEPVPPAPAPPAGRPPAAAWLKRLGVAGFLFFLIKGLLWLIVPAVLIGLGVDCGTP